MTTIVENTVNKWNERIGTMAPTLQNAISGVYDYLVSISGCEGGGDAYTIHHDPLFFAEFGFLFMHGYIGIDDLVTDDLVTGTLYVTNEGNDILSAYLNRAGLNVPPYQFT